MCIGKYYFGIELRRDNFNFDNLQVPSATQFGIRTHWSFKCKVDCSPPRKMVYVLKGIKACKEREASLKVVVLCSPFGFMFRGPECESRPWLLLNLGIPHHPG